MELGVVVITAPLPAIAEVVLLIADDDSSPTNLDEAAANCPQFLLRNSARIRRRATVSILFCRCVANAISLYVSLLSSSSSSSSSLAVTTTEDNAGLLFGIPAEVASRQVREPLRCGLMSDPVVVTEWVRSWRLA